MKKIHLLAMLFAMLGFVACSHDDFVSQLATDLKVDNLAFSYEGGEQSFSLTSNEEWSMNSLPDWVTVVVKDAVATRSLNYAEGNKELTVTVQPNADYAARSTELILTSLSGKSLNLKIEQQKKPELVGYWILSEGYAGKGNTELAWYDVATKQLSKKQFVAINGTALGDTGNDLKIYGSKMYCVVTGPGFGTAATEGTNYIEVINPADGKSIKRIPFVDAKGAPAKPRNIIFEGGKAYISSYSNEVVRLDTLSLTLDAHAALSGTLAENLCYNDGKIYVCNSGQGEDNKISVVDPGKMQEDKVITTEKNPTGIVSAAKGTIYFSTNYNTYKLFKLTTANDQITEVTGLKVGNMTMMNGQLYACSFDWTSYKGSSYVLDPATDAVTELDFNLSSVGIEMLMEYHIGQINGTDDLFLTGMGQDVVILNPQTKEIKYAFQTGVANGNSVVAYYK